MSNPAPKRVFTELHKKRISESMKGKTHSEETKKKVSESMKGKTHSEETKKKMSESTKGRYKGENHPMWGKTHSEETRKKLSEVKKGEINPNAKLNEKQVFQILFLKFYRKVSQSRIAKAFNVAQPNISDICRRKKWIEQYDAFFEMEPYKHLKPQR